MECWRKVVGSTPQLNLSKQPSPVTHTLTCPSVASSYTQKYGIGYQNEALFLLEHTTCVAYHRKITKSKKTSAQGPTSRAFSINGTRKPPRQPVQSSNGLLFERFCGISIAVICFSVLPCLCSPSGSRRGGRSFSSWRSASIRSNASVGDFFILDRPSWMLLVIVQSIYSESSNWHLSLPISSMGSMVPCAYWQQEPCTNNDAGQVQLNRI